MLPPVSSKYHTPVHPFETIHQGLLFRKVLTVPATRVAAQTLWGVRLLRVEWSNESLVGPLGIEPRTP